MSKTKVLFRLRSLEMGGVQKVILDVLEHLPKERLDITLMVNLNQGELRDKIPTGIKYIKLARGKEEFSTNRFLRKIQLGRRLLWLKVLDKLPFLLNALYYKENYDVEIACGRAELNVVLKSPQRNSRKIAWVHWEFSHAPELNQSQLLVEQLQKFDHVIFCSANVKTQVKELYDVVFPHSSVIPNVVHPQDILALSKKRVRDFPEVSEEVFTFVSVGRVKNGKGYPLLLEVHKVLLDEGLKHRIIIIGNGDKLEDLRSRARELGVSDSFILLGSRNNPFPYMAKADAFILPTQSEAYPLSVKEALVIGLPALVTDVGGVSEIVRDGVDGILMKFDRDDISQKMKKLLTQPELLLRLQAGARDAVSHFETDSAYLEIENVLLNVGAI